MKRLFTLLLTLFLLATTNAQAQLNNHPDRIATNSGDLVIHPVLHGSLVLQWNGINIYVDPYGGADRYQDKGTPHLILITHPHGDHLNKDTLAGLDTSNATFIVPQVVANEMPAPYAGQLKLMANGDSTEMHGITIKAMPMYNLPEEGARHAKGWGNGYVLNIGGQDVYLSGDTEDIPEMRNLNSIDIAFVCMNLPYTMDVTQAADAVLDFAPTIVYPYHHRGQDIHEFKSLVDAGDKAIEVRLKDWYVGGE